MIPPGCEADLSGAWVHADDARWRYDALDDGGTLTFFVAPPPLDAGVVFRKFGHRDAGLADAGVADAGLHATITLTRGPAGFVGDVQAVVSVAPSAQCPVRWPTTLVSCTDGLTLETVAASEVLPDCTQPPADAGPPTRHRLIRPDAGLDGG